MTVTLTEEAFAIHTLLTFVEHLILSITAVVVSGVAETRVSVPTYPMHIAGIGTGAGTRSLILHGSEEIIA